MRVVIAPDSFGGTLTARAAAQAIAEGWRRSRPDDELVLRPLSDGGEGLITALRGDDDELAVAEVAGPLGLPVRAHYLLRPDGTALVETAAACGLALVPPERRAPMHATTYGVGQLLVAAAEATGARRIIVGLGGSATIDGGAGLLSGIGFRLMVGDGSGLKVGAADLGRVAAVRHGWASRRLLATEIEVWSDVRTTLPDAVRIFGPQKGATPEDVQRATAAITNWADVAEAHFAVPGLRTVPGTGAAGGLGFGLAAGLGAPLLDGASAVADEVQLDADLEKADLVVVGEGRLDATSFEGKIVEQVVQRARAGVADVVAVVGQATDDVRGRLECEEASPAGPGDDPAEDVAAAAARLAAAL